MKCLRDNCTRKILSFHSLYCCWCCYDKDEGGAGEDLRITGNRHQHTKDCDTYNPTEQKQSEPEK
jgi:hypothetical protein